MEPLDILRKFLISNRFEWMGKVFLHPGGWSVAANPSCIMAFKGEVGEKFDPHPPLPILKQPRPAGAVKVELSSLLKWVSKFKPSLEVTDVNIKYQGVIAGVNVDLRKLVFILKFLPPGDVFLWDSTRAQEIKSLGFERGPWRVCLAGVGSDAADCSNVFEVDESVLDLVMDLESE